MMQRQIQKKVTDFPLPFSFSKVIGFIMFQRSLCSCLVAIDEDNVLGEESVKIRIGGELGHG